MLTNSFEQLMKLLHCLLCNTQHITGKHSAPQALGKAGEKNTSRNFEFYCCPRAPLGRENKKIQKFKIFQEFKSETSELHGMGAGWDGRRKEGAGLPSMRATCIRFVIHLRIPLLIVRTAYIILNSNVIEASPSSGILRSL